MTFTALLLQAARAAQDTTAPPQTDWVDSLVNFLDTPAPFSPLTEYLLVLFLLWLLARRTEPKPDFDRQAQEVLDEKYQRGELSKEAYDKYRQDMSLRKHH